MKSMRLLSVAAALLGTTMAQAFTFEYYGYATTSASLYSGSGIVASSSAGSICRSGWAAHGGGDWMSYSDRTSSIYPYSFFYTDSHTDTTVDGWYVGGFDNNAGYTNLSGTTIVPTVRGFFTGINDRKVLVTSQGDLFDSTSGQLTAMGNFTAVEINNSNVVVGYRGTSSSPIPVRWKNGSLYDLQLPAGVSSAKALDVREDGFIIGRTNSGQIIGWDRFGNGRVWTETSQVYNLGFAEGGALVFQGRLNGEYGPWILEESNFVSLKPTLQSYLYSPFDAYYISWIGDGTIVFTARTYEGDPTTGDIWRNSHVYGRLQAVPEPGTMLALAIPLVAALRNRRRK